MLIDSHAHLDMSQFDHDRDDVINRAKSKGVEHIITIGTDLESNKRAIDIADKYPDIYAAIGIHPHEVKDIEDNTYDEIKELIKNSKKIVAYGEIGLDFHYLYSPEDVQIKRFREQIDLASEFNLPLIIHSREAEIETIDILREAFKGKKGLNGVLHCFSGNIEMAENVIEMGFYISFSGIVTFKKADKIQSIVKKIPVEYIIIETDSPYLAPQPFRGKRNEPVYIEHICRKISELNGLSFEDVSRITSFNTMTLFGFGETEDKGRFVYKIRDSLYLNITNRCTDACTFCVRYYTNVVKGHNLRLNREPDTEEIIKEIGDPERYKEIVFCGYGEPLLRLDLVKKIAGWVKKNGGRVRIDTNGHGNLIHKRNILPELHGLVDEISVSLNAENSEKYYKLCQPMFGRETYSKIKEFIKEAKRYIPDVGVTVINIPSIDLVRCREIASSELKVKFRVREYNVVG